MWARHHLPLNNPPMQFAPSTPVIKNHLELRRTENAGMSFSIGHNHPRLMKYVFLPISVLLMALIGYWLYTLPAQAFWTSIKFGLVAGGALGNILERLWHGKVTDFIVWILPKWLAMPSRNFYEWPTFNLADAFLVVGLILLFINRPRDKALAAKADSKK